MRWILAAALALLLTSPAFGQADQGPFDFKGIQLGATLAQMRAISLPEHDGRARVFCTGDPAAHVITHHHIRPSAEEAAAGVVRCAFYRHPPHHSDYTELASFRLGASDQFAQDYQFDFYPDPNTGEHRLYRIYLRGNVRATPHVLLALRERFGPPRQEESALAQNNMGAEIEQTTTRWERADSSLRVVSPAGRTDRMRIFYTLTELAALADASVQQERRRQNPM